MENDKNDRRGGYRYPQATKQEGADDFHGILVGDPYRWLEDPDSPETIAWVEAENRLTREYLDAYPGRAGLTERVKDLLDYQRYSLPERHGDHYFYSKNDGLQNQPVVYRQKTLDGDPTVVIDPNQLSGDGTAALTTTAYSHDGRLLAYGVSEGGSDWQTIRIRDTETGNDYDESIKWCRFAGIGWTHDNRGFFYNRFPAEGEGPPEEQHRNSKVFYHELGTLQEDDALVYADKENPNLGFWPFVSDDGEYVVLYVYDGTDPRNGVYVRRVDEDGPFDVLLRHGEARFQPIDNVGSVFYFETDLEAPRRRVIAIDVESSERENWAEIIPEKEGVIDGVAVVADHFIVKYMYDAHHRIELFHADGAAAGRLELPAIGSVEETTGRRHHRELFFSFTSFVYPTTAYRYDFDAGELTVLRKPEVDFDPSPYVTRQVFCASKDGTRVPMFLTHREDLTLNKNNPVWLYGYGGFNISLTPDFRVSRLPWLEAGGVYAVANIRGGAEYGEQWYRSGTLDQKQNVFDDFMAAADYLVAEKYTSPDKIVINGGSNGGLLVAACMTQRPDLFGAVVCQVPVIDMLRYHRFTIGRYWVSDYGNADEDPEQFEYLLAYSPLHNVKDGVAYPATLITSADTDDRVVPAHAKKFAARLQEAQAGDNPILLRVDMKSGHGLGKPTTKIIAEIVDIYSFVFRALDLSS